MKSPVAHEPQLSAHDREILAPLARPAQARHLLEGRCGPLLALPFEPEIAATAYLVHLAYRRARAPGNMLSGRPTYEAAETLLGRVLSVAVCVGSLREFGHTLFERLGMSISQLRPEDALWWREAQAAHGGQWRHLQERIVLTEVCTAARLLDDWFFELGRVDDAAPAAAEGVLVAE